MRIYTAGPWACREQMRSVAQQLRDAGHTVECRWLDVHVDLNEMPIGRDIDKVTFLREQAEHDLEDLINSDLLLYCNFAKSEGKATELGVAIGQRMPVIIVGGRENNVFLNLDFPIFHTVEEAIAWLAGVMENASKMYGNGE